MRTPSIGCWPVGPGSQQGEPRQVFVLWQTQRDRGVLDGVPRNPPGPNLVKMAPRRGCAREIHSADAQRARPISNNNFWNDEDTAITSTRRSTRELCLATSHLTLAQQATPRPPTSRETVGITTTAGRRRGCIVTNHSHRHARRRVLFGRRPLHPPARRARGLGPGTRTARTRRIHPTGESCAVTGASRREIWRSIGTPTTPNRRCPAGGRGESSRRAEHVPPITQTTTPAANRARLRNPQHPTGPGRGRGSRRGQRRHRRRPPPTMAYRPMARRAPPSTEIIDPTKGIFATHATSAATSPAGPPRALRRLEPRALPERSRPAASRSPGPRRA